MSHRLQRSCVEIRREKRLEKHHLVRGIPSLVQKTTLWNMAAIIGEERAEHERETNITALNFSLFCNKLKRALMRRKEKKKERTWVQLLDIATKICCLYWVPTHPLNKCAKIRCTDVKAKIRELRECVLKLCPVLFLAKKNSRAKSNHERYLAERGRELSRYITADMLQKCEKSC